jgi:hypothetical protein
MLVRVAVVMCPSIVRENAVDALKRARRKHIDEVSQDRVKTTKLLRYHEFWRLQVITSSLDRDQVRP